MKWRKDRQQWNGGNEDNSEMEETETTVNWRKPKPWNRRNGDNKEMEERENSGTKKTENSKMEESDTTVEWTRTGSAT